MDRQPNRLVELLTWALVAEFGAAFVHHIYGGFHYGTAERLWMAFGFVIALVVTVALLKDYSKRGRKAALAMAAGKRDGQSGLASDGVHSGARLLASGPGLSVPSNSHPESDSPQS